MHVVYLLSVLIIGKDIFKNIKRQVIRAIKGEIQGQAVTADYWKKKSIWMKIIYKHKTKEI